MSRTFICTSSEIFNFKKNTKYKTDDNGYYDFGGGLKVNLSTNENFKEYIPRHLTDNNYYFVKDRYAENRVKNIPCVIVEEVNDLRVIVCRVTNINAYSVDTAKKLYSLSKFSDKDLITIELHKLEKRIPYWFINSEGKICNGWKESTPSDVISWRIKTNNLFDNYDDCAKARQNILIG